MQTWRRCTFIIRPPRNQAQADKIRISNRRMEYLNRNPAYFESLEHEFADPLRYDELIRKYQTPAEREADQKAKGYGRMLEASLLRSEARIAKAAAIAAGEEDTGYAFRILPKQSSRPATPDGTQPEETIDLVVYQDVFLLDEPPKTRSVAKGKWDAFLRSRFVDGLDEDFDYTTVDDNEEYDGFLRQLQEDNYFEDEEPEWASSGDDVDMEGTDDREKTKPERLLQGQTGVQDY